MAAARSLFEPRTASDVDSASPVKFCPRLASHHELAGKPRDVPPSRETGVAVKNHGAGPLPGAPGRSLVSTIRRRRQGLNCH